MNRDALIFNLLQAREEIDKLIAECKAGGHDDDGPYVLGQNFSEIVNYLCNAWHHRLLSGEALEKLSKEELEKLSTLIPNFCFKFQFDESFGKTPATEGE